ncbi:hypothetical protein VSR68_42225, partial [Paraburkholderia phymatum]|uniref:hypothetical protein n=1 Tax=Paraburkholderia phymatum TaxID=148447 RepID=UPI00316D789E
MQTFFLRPAIALTLIAAGVAAQAAHASQFQPGNLVVSRGVYDNKSSNVQPGTVLPPNCAST